MAKNLSHVSAQSKLNKLVRNTSIRLAPARVERMPESFNRRAKTVLQAVSVITLHMGMFAVADAYFTPEFRELCEMVFDLAGHFGPHRDNVLIIHLLQNADREVLSAKL